MEEERNNNLPESIEEFFGQVLEDFGKFLEFIGPPARRGERFGVAKDFIGKVFSIKERKRKEILMLVRKVLDSDAPVSAAFIELLLNVMLAELNSKQLVKKVLEFKNYNVASFLLMQALREEARAKKPVKYFSDEEKSALITFMFSCGLPVRLFVDSDELLSFARALPHEKQKNCLNTALKKCINIIFRERTCLLHTRGGKVFLLI